MEDSGLPLGYPGALSDDELADALEVQLQWLKPHQASPGLNPTERLALIQAGLQEESRRLIASSIEEAQAARRSATAFACLSLVIAAAAVVIALFSGFSDYFGDQGWQDDQTRILTEIRDRLPPR